MGSLLRKRLLFSPVKQYAETKSKSNDIPSLSIGASKSLKENVSSDLDNFEMVNPLSAAGVAFEHHSAGDNDADMEECFDAMDRVGLSKNKHTVSWMS